MYDPRHDFAEPLAEGEFQGTLVIVAIWTMALALTLSLLGYYDHWF